MDAVKAVLTVYFEEPFWVGLYERTVQGQYQAAKIFFGAEPKGCEVYDLILQQWQRFHFSEYLQAAHKDKKPTNPKRLQRAIKKQLQAPAMGTKAQQALKLQHAQQKINRNEQRHKQWELEQAQRFAKKQQKQKEKHRGH